MDARDLGWMENYDMTSYDIARVPRMSQVLGIRESGLVHGLLGLLRAVHLLRLHTQRATTSGARTISCRNSRCAVL
jgi:hypothetical protein